MKLCIRVVDILKMSMFGFDDPRINFDRTTAF